MQALRCGWLYGCVLLLSTGLADGAQWLAVEGYGNGGDGELSISSSMQQVQIVAGCSGTAGSSSLSATHGSFAAGQMLLIHQSRGTNAGNWELNAIQSYVAGTITTRYPLAISYSSSGVNRAQVVVLKQYSKVTVASGGYWSAPPWDGNTGGILAFMCDGSTTVAGNITADAAGFRGGSGTAGGQQGEGTAADRNAISTAANGNGGGGGWNNAFPDGGGGGGNAVAGNKGARLVTAGGLAWGNDPLSLIAFGGGGGGGGSSWSGQYRRGGTGGGMVLILSRELAVTGTISAHGGGGASQGGSSGAAGQGAAGGGGGAGGSILCKCNTATLGSNRVLANGGPCGSGWSNEAYDGGPGSVGRVHLDYGTSYTGTTTAYFTSAANVVYKGNQQPASFDLTAPANSANLSVSRPTFSWNAAPDPEGIAVTYTLQLSTDAAFSHPLYRILAGLHAASYTPPVGEELPNGTYYWKVTATDGVMERTANQVRQFTINRAMPSLPTISSLIWDIETARVQRINGWSGSDSPQSVTLLVRDPSTGIESPASGSILLDGAHFTCEPTGGIMDGSVVRVQSVLDGGSQLHSSPSTLSFEAVRDVHSDSSVFHGDSGRSMRLQGSTRYGFKLAVNGGAAVTVTAQLRKNAAYLGDAPTLTLTGLGITGVGSATAAMTVGADAWESVTVSGTPNQAGVLTLTVQSFTTDGQGALWIDAVSVSQ